jgi:hypothetical protein
VHIKTEAHVRDLLARLYREIGGNPNELIITPLFGTWSTALKYRIVRTDNATTSVWRKDIEDNNQTAIIAALQSFHRTRA